MISELISPGMHEILDGLGNAGQEGMHGIKEILIGAALPIGFMMIRGRMHNGGHNGGHEPVAKRHGRVSRIEPGELGLRERGGSFYDVEKVVKGGLVAYKQKKFYGLVTPGWHKSLHPNSRWEFINTKNQPLELAPFKTKGGDKRLHDIKPEITWGHIKGVDDYGDFIRYFKTDGTPVSVQQLVLNGIMAAREERGVAAQVRQIISGSLRTAVLDRESLRTASIAELYGEVETDCHDRLLDIGTELRQLQLTELEHNQLDHFGHILTDGSRSEGLSWSWPAVAVALGESQIPGLHVIHSDDIAAGQA